MSELKLYNTLTRTKETFRPIDPANVRMYVCGPTVYDFAHIGNARPVIVFDVLYRLLRHLYGAEHVTYVRNITDVDDKINARALGDHGEAIAAGTMTLNEAIARVTEKTADQFHADVKALGCLEPSFEPRATQHISGMVAMIQRLLDKGCAYVASGEEGAEVLFDVTAMPDYGALSRRNLDEQQAGARVAVEKHKKHPGDFVLWKQSGAQAPGWEATFRFEGRAVAIFGRPGWHIECSVMSAAHLGPVFDIHGGGIDLVFPHHENEIAQSRCAHGTPVMAKYWLHNGFLQVEGRKMAKSEGNFVTIRDLLHTEKFGGRKWPGEVLRLAMLMTHYREPIDFSVRRLEEAENIWRSFATVVREFVAKPDIDKDVVDCLLDDLDVGAAIKRLQALRSASAHDVDSGRRLLGSLRLLGFFEQAFPVKLQMFSTSLDDVDELLRQNTGLADDVELKTIAERLDARSEQAAAAMAAQLRLFVPRTTMFDYRKTRAQGLSIRDLQERTDRRLALIREKNFAEADKIRDELAARGIQLMDYKDPQTGERWTKWEVKR